MIRIVDCPCGHILKGANDEELFRAARRHVTEEHPGMERSDAEIRARIAQDARNA